MLCLPIFNMIPSYSQKFFGVIIDGGEKIAVLIHIPKYFRHSNIIIMYCLLQYYSVHYVKKSLRYLKVIFFSFFTNGVSNAASVRVR